MMKRLFAKNLMFVAGAAAALAFPVAFPGFAARAADTFTVTKAKVEDRKAVFATVESTDVQSARARIGGTVAGLDVDEGDSVTDGQKIAVVGDPKLMLKLQSLDASIQSILAQRDQAQADLTRAEQLFKQGVVPKAKLDEQRTATQVYDRNAAAQRAERQVIVQQAAEGAVLAPGAGRVLEVKVRDGAVVMAGEEIATIAAGGYLLRLEVPERHARFIKQGDTVQVGARGLMQAQSEPPPAAEALRQGTVVKVYPRLHNGRVMADILVEGLGDYFVGERAVVYIATGVRNTFAVPADYLTVRYGVTYATLQDGTEVVVQTGSALPATAATAAMVEVLAGLRDGDVLAKPTAATAH